MLQSEIGDCLGNFYMKKERPTILTQVTVVFYLIVNSLCFQSCLHFPFWI